MMTDAKDAAKKIHGASVAHSNEPTFEELQRDFDLERKRLVSLTRPEYQAEHSLFEKNEVVSVDESGRQRLMDAVHNQPLPNLSRRSSYQARLREELLISSRIDPSRYVDVYEFSLETTPEEVARRRKAFLQEAVDKHTEKVTRNLFGFTKEEVE